MLGCVGVYVLCLCVCMQGHTQGCFLLPGTPNIWYRLSLSLILNQYINSIKVLTKSSCEDIDLAMYFMSIL